jgi:hypothetical protein
LVATGVFFASAHSEEILMGQRVQPSIIGFESGWFSGHGQLLDSAVHRAVVIENAKNRLIRRFTGMRKLFDKVRIVGFLSPLGYNPQKSAVDENGYFENWHKNEKPP